jgi:hypothetical protein
MSSERDERENRPASSTKEGMQIERPASTSPRPIDAERIASLIDGRLSPEDRAALLAELDTTAEAFEIYNDAVAALRDGDTQAPAIVVSGSSPSRRSSRSFRFYAPIIALAAVLVIAVALPVLRRAGTSGLEGPGAVAGMLQPMTDATAMWRRAPWTESRGSSEALSTRARGIRIGARIVDLDLLVRSRDTSAARVALQVATLLEGIPAGTVAASAYRSIAAQGINASPDALGRAGAFAEKVVGPTEVRVGAWIEAARFAAVQRNTSFFESMHRDEIARGITSLPTSPAAAQMAFAELTRLLDASPRDWIAVENALTVLLREVADG